MSRYKRAHGVSRLDSWLDGYVHARTRCGCGPWESLYRATYELLTKRWPW